MFGPGTPAPRPTGFGIDNQTRPDQTKYIMKIVNIQAAKTHLSRLVEQAVAGEDIVLAKAGRPLVRLTVFNPQAGPRPLGILRGRVREDRRCWDRDQSLETDFNEAAIIPGTPPKQRQSKSRA